MPKANQPKQDERRRDDQQKREREQQQLPGQPRRSDRDSETHRSESEQKRGFGK